MRDVLVTLIFVAGSVGALTRPWLGVLLWAWLDYMSPQMLCYGFALRIPFVQLTAGVTLLGFLLSNEPKRFPITRETVLLLIFILWMTLTTCFALNQAETWDAWGRAVKVQAFIVAVLIIIRTPERIDALVWVMAASIGYYGVRGGVGTLLTGAAYRVYGPDNTYIADNNDLALALVTTLPLVRYLQLRAEKGILRLGLGAVLGAIVLSVLASYSRAGMLALAVVAFLLALKSLRKGLFLCSFVLALCFALKFMPDQWFARMATIQDYQEDASAKQRLNSWNTAWSLALDRPLVGGGFRAFTAELYEKYSETPDYHEAHNIFLKILAEHGFPGLFLFLLLAFCTWRTASHVRRSALALPSCAWAADLVSMTQISLLGFAVGGCFSNLAYFDLAYGLMAIVVLCKLFVEQAAIEKEAGPEAECEGGSLDAGISGVYAN